MTDYKLTTSVACLRHHILTSQGVVDSPRLKDLELIERTLEALTCFPETDLKRNLQALLHDTVMVALVDWTDSQMLPAEQHSEPRLTFSLRTQKGGFPVFAEA